MDKKFYHIIFLRCLISELHMRGTHAQSKEKKTSFMQSHYKLVTWWGISKYVSWPTQNSLSIFLKKYISIFVHENMKKML